MLKCVQDLNLKFYNWTLEYSNLWENFFDRTFFSVGYIYISYQKRRKLRPSFLHNLNMVKCSKNSWMEITYLTSFGLLSKCAVSRGKETVPVTLGLFKYWNTESLNWEYPSCNRICSELTRYFSTSREAIFSLNTFNFINHKM